MHPFAAPYRVDTDEARWRALVEASLAGATLESLATETLDGVTIRPLYGKAVDPPSWPLPAARPWGLAQRLDERDPVAANAQALADLRGGADTLVLVPAGTARARGGGVELRHSHDLETALAGIDLTAITLRVEAGRAGERVAEMFVALADRRRESLGDWGLALGLDPVGTFATAGRLEADWPETAARAAALLASLRDRGFRGRAFTADGRPYAEAGASEAQELAAVLATGVALLRGLEANGLALAQARDAIDFTLAADQDLSLTIAKLRALRLLWQQVEAASGLAPQPLRLHCETAWRMMARRDPRTNLVRTALAALAAVVGGADSLTVLPFDAARGPSDAAARRIARNTQHVLAAEANLWRVTDPVAGAGAFEALTLDLAAEAWRLFQEIEREGGIVASLRAGALQARIAAVRARRTGRIAAGQAHLVGVTAYRASDEAQEWAPPRAAPLAPSAAAAPALVCDPLPALRDAEPFEVQEGCDP